MICKLVSRIVDIEDDPLMFTLEMTHSPQIPCVIDIVSLKEFSCNNETLPLHTTVKRLTRTKFKTYCEQINPGLITHPIYTDANIS